MYSPKINERLIQRLYRLKQSLQEKKPITKMVNEAVAEYLNRHEAASDSNIPESKPDPLPPDKQHGCDSK